MAQNDYGNPLSPFTGTQLNNRLRDWRDALHTLHLGMSRPAYAVAGMLWIRDISSTEWRLYLYDGDTDILIGTINPAADAFTPAGVTGFAPLTGATFTGAVTLPASDPTDVNHAARKGYVDAGDVWVKLVDAAIANSTVIDLTGFSLQNYRQITVMLLGASLSSASSNNILAEIFRNGLLVTTGYFFVRETAAGTTMTVASNNNHPLFGLTFNGVNTNPLMSVIDIVQPSSNNDVVIYAYTVHRDSPTGNINNYRTGVIINGGSGWTDGVRITAPTAFVANAGRIVVLGLKP
jgi:membrane-bound metal-dependent hydrolase YbcI (DUF457 family)